MDAINTPSSDPLMIIDFARSFTTESVVLPGVLILSMVLGGIVLLIELFLFNPIVFHWKHARNLHFTAIISAAATCFFLFVASLNTTSAVSASIAAITTVSLQVVEAERGILLEAFLWSACSLWFLVFVFLAWIRWWEILERRETKKKAGREDREKKRKASLAAASAAQKDKPMKAEDAVLQQMAAAQMY